MAQFMLLIRGGDQEQDMTAEQYQQDLQRYIAWAGQLRAEGRMLGGDELAEGGRTVRRRAGAVVVEGPFAEAAEGVGGYFLITASDLDEAATIAGRCPVLDKGGCVEVRQVNEH